MNSISTTSRLRTLDLTYIALFAVLTAICAWTTLPLVIPFTLQTFAIFMALNTLGGRRGTYAILVYLLMGLVGLPVFAGAQGGIGVLLGPTGGYLLSFLLSGISYWVLTAQFGTSVSVRAAASLFGLGLDYLFGTIWFLTVYQMTTGSIGWLAALQACVIPFILPDLGKLALALHLSRILRPHLH